MRGGVGGGGREADPYPDFDDCGPPSPGDPQICDSFITSIDDVSLHSRQASVYQPLQHFE